VLTKLIYLQGFISIVFTNFAISTQITVAYTDGSKAGERVASTIVYKGSLTKSTRLPNLTSIFRAELYALFLTIDVGKLVIRLLRMAVQRTR